MPSVRVVWHAGLVVGANGRAKNHHRDLAEEESESAFLVGDEQVVDTIGNKEVVRQSESSGKALGGATPAFFPPDHLVFGSYGSFDLGWNQSSPPVRDTTSKRQLT